MNLLDSILLGAVQGITEFLPVSSTAHTTLCENLFSVHSFGKSYNVLLNIGTLLSLMIYFYRDSLKLVRGGWDFVFNCKSSDKDFFLIIFLSDLPVIGLFGVLEIMGVDVNSKEITAVNLVIFAIILYLCDRSPITKTELTLKDGLKIGVVQVLSFLPGVSRLGICLSMCRYLGYNRRKSFEISMILSIIPVVGACFFKLLKMKLEFMGIDVFTGILAAFVFGVVSISVIDRFFKNHTFLVFVIYRIVFGFFVWFI